MPRSGEEVRQRLQEAALELYLEHGFDQTTTGAIAARAGVTERTFFRHFADKREVFFDGEAELRDLLTGAVAAAPPGTKPLPALRAAFQAAVPLVVRNRPVAEPRFRVIAVTPALRERSLAKREAIVGALAEALRARGVDDGIALLCAQVAMDAFTVASRRWWEDSSVGLDEHVDRTFRDLRLAAAALR